jgi:S1-C subfamily serine protease
VTSVFRLEQLLRFTPAMKSKCGFIFILTLLTFSARSISTDAQQLRDAFRKVNQSVVIVRTKHVELAPSGDDGMLIIDGLGSGVLISNDGKVLTAAHVVQTADIACVEFPDGQAIRARVIGSDVRSDVALLQLERMPKGVTPAILGDSDKVEVGDQIFVIGAPYGIGQTLSAGHLSGRHQLNNNNESATSVEFLQTDAAVNTGNSGAPMFDMGGNVIGVVSSIMSRSGGSEGLAFGTAANTAKRLLLDHTPFWSGIDGFVITGDLAKALNLPQPAGFLVQRIGEGSMGSRLGINPGTLRATIQGTDILLAGDVLLTVNGIDIATPSRDQLGIATADENYERIYNSVAALRPGDILVVTVLRQGKVLKLTTTIER